MDPIRTCQEYRFEASELPNLSRFLTERGFRHCLDDPAREGSLVLDHPFTKCGRVYNERSGEDDYLILSVFSETRLERAINSYEM